MPLYGSGSGLPSGGAPGQIIAKTAQGETVWVDPVAGAFRGDWGPDQLAYSYDFTEGLGLFVGSVTDESRLGVRNFIPEVVTATELAQPNPPVSAVAAKMRISNSGTGYGSRLTLDLSQLGLANISRVRFKHGAFATSPYANHEFSASLNQVKYLTKGETFGWEFGETSASSTDVVAWTAHNATYAPNSGSDVRYYVTDIEVYVADDPYMLGHFVTHEGHMYKSLIDNNSSMPGASDSWVEALTMPNSAGATAERPDPVVAGAGFPYYDTTLVRPIWSDGAIWRDASGVAV